MKKNYYFMHFKLKLKLYINSIIALVTLKLSIGSKKLPKFYMKQFILSIGYRKNFKVKPEFDRHSHSKPNHILLNSDSSSLMFLFVSIVSEKIAKFTQIFTTAFMYDLMRY